MRRRNRGIGDIYPRSTGVSARCANCRRMPWQEMLPRYRQLFAEVVELFRFGFQVVVLLVGKHEIQEDETGLDELH